MRVRKAAAAALLAILLILGCFAPGAAAAGDVTFLAVNDELLPLSDYYMPIYDSGGMYLPYDVFTSYGLGLYLSRSSSGAVICLYNSDHALYFNLEEGTSFDKSQTSYDISAIETGDTWYVPVSLVCSCFGILQSWMDASPAPVIRLKYSGATTLTDRQFLVAREYQMRTRYNDYMGIVEPTESPEPTPQEEPPAPVTPPVPETPVTPASPEPSVPEVTPTPESPPPEETEEPRTFENTTVFMSFLGVDGAEETAPALSGGESCYFVTAEDVLAHADTIRMLSGTGCGIGVYLREGTREEYEDVTELLYEAAKVKTVLVYADEACYEAAAATCEASGCVMWNADRLLTDEYDLQAFGTSRPESDGMRENLVFSLGERYDLLSGFLSSLREQKYNIGTIRENTTPTLLID